MSCDKKNIPNHWSDLSYAGEVRVPTPADPSSYSWPLFFLKRNAKGNYTDGYGNSISFNIRPASTIDFAGEQLSIVKQTLKDLTPDKVCIAEYWNAGPPTKQWTPIIDRLIDTYGVSASQAARILAAVHGGINDALAVTWYYKYKFNVPRANQLDQNLKTICCTPNHPSYPAGHGVVAGCAEVLLSYFFEPEQHQLRKLAEECAMSRLYAGVHYHADNEQGLKLGRQIGKVIISTLNKQYDEFGAKVDVPITEYRKAKLMPPPYKQVIGFSRGRNCKSLLDPKQCPESR